MLTSRDAKCVYINRFQGIYCFSHTVQLLRPKLKTTASRPHVSLARVLKRWCRLDHVERDALSLKSWYSTACGEKRRSHFETSHLDPICGEERALALRYSVPRCMWTGARSCFGIMKLDIDVERGALSLQNTRS
jgi:hypothetical protein